MKKLIFRLNFYLYLCLLPFTAFAGTAVISPAPTLSPEVTTIESIFFGKAGSLAVYPSYDPYLTVNGVKHAYGWGAALLYPVSDYAFAGVRLDYLAGTFWAPSAVIGAKYTLSKIRFTPTVFTVGGIILPLSGAGSQNTTAEAVTGVGATAVLWHTKDGSFSVNAFVEGEKWTNFQGVIVHPGIAGAIKF